MSLPDGVQAVRKPSGKVYYYLARHRGTARAEPRIPLGSDPHDPEFWRRINGDRPAAKGTFSALIDDYRASPEWFRLRPASQRDYSFYLDRLDVSAGDRQVTALTAPDIYKLRDDMGATPHAANHMLAILRALLKWGIERGYRRDNPAIGIARIRTDENGTRPWPEDGYAFVLAHAPTVLRRMAALGRATGQRIGDLVRMRACDLVEDGIRLRIGKRREAEHFVPLTADQLRELRSWGVADLDFFLTSAAGKRLGPRTLNEIWRRWRKSDSAKPIRSMRMTPHGLRATAVADRQLAGTEDNGIAAELGMSVQMVTRYSRFADKAAKARASRDRRERGQNRI